MNKEDLLELENKITQLLGLNCEVKYKIISGVNDSFFGIDGLEVHKLFMKYKNTKDAMYSIQINNSEDGFTSYITIREKI